MLKNTLLKLIAITVTLLFFSACSDSGTNAIEDNDNPVEEAPALPNLEYSQPDISYFENTSVQNKAISNNFLFAKNLVTSFGNLNSIVTFYTTIISSAQPDEGTLNNGVWEWTYDFSFEGLSSEIRITASESANAITWEIFISVDDGDNSIEDYKIMEGTTQDEGLSGSWTLNSPEPETDTPIPFLNTSWETDGETVSQIITEFLDESGSMGSLLINFDRNDNEHLMNLDFADASEDKFEIFWDTAAAFGYIKEGNDDPLCWDSSESVIDISCDETPS
jgi:hypothetical protein